MRLGNHLTHHQESPGTSALIDIRSEDRATRPIDIYKPGLNRVFDPRGDTIMVISLPVIVSYAIKGGLDAISFFSKPFRMQLTTVPFVTLFRHSTCNDTASFVNTHFHDAKRTLDPLHNLRHRFMVRVIGVNKADTVIKHESVGVWIIDKDTGEHHTITLNRSPSGRSHAAAFKFFSECPESQEILESIRRAIKAMHSMSVQATTSALKSLSHMTLLPTDESNTESASIPLLPVMEDTKSDTESASTSTSQPSLGDVFASHVVRVAVAMREGSKSVSPMNFAEDIVSGIDFLDEEKCIRRFYPRDLSLFDLVLVADVVHDKAPIYSLFANQCYWFANIIFEIVVQLYILPAATRDAVGTLDPSGPYPTPGPYAIPDPPSIPLAAPTPEVDPPRNANHLILPALGEAGRWCSILINDPIVRQTVMGSIISDFKERLAYYLSEVIFHQICIIDNFSLNKRFLLKRLPKL